MSVANRLIWLDLEMTGLEPDHDVILEIATIVTDNNLNIIAEGPVIAIHQPAELLEGMDEWCTKTHTQSGLVKRVQESAINVHDAQEQTLAFLQQHVKAGESPLCGNSVHQDRRFLYRYMPKLAEYFHYRNLDVSTLKILAQRWAPEIYGGFKKESTHLALQDIRDSIDELKYYRDHFIKY